MITYLWLDGITRLFNRIACSRNVLIQTLYYHQILIWTRIWTQFDLLPLLEWPEDKLSVFLFFLKTLVYILRLQFRSGLDSISKKSKSKFQNSNKSISSSISVHQKWRQKPVVTGLNQCWNQSLSSRCDWLIAMLQSRLDSPHQSGSPIKPKIQTKIK